VRRPREPRRVGRKGELTSSNKAGGRGGHEASLTSGLPNRLTGDGERSKDRTREHYRNVRGHSTSSARAGQKPMRRSTAERGPHRWRRRDVLTDAPTMRWRMIYSLRRPMLTPHVHE